MDEAFKLDVFSEAKADVYLACAGEPPWQLVTQLDQAGYRVVGDLPGLQPDEDRIRRIMKACSSVVALAGSQSSDVLRALRIGSELGRPVYELQSGDTLPELEAAAEPVPAYAFMIGRLERDFSHAREAIRAAVETEAGLPCLWIDDGRHRTNIESVRERTRLLIKHATFVIAELTLGVESPERENPSRAHEIGMALAYGRRLMLSSQEPRRYPYFSIADMQMTFWDTESELEQNVRGWIRANRESVARRVFNFELREAKIARRSFGYDPKMHFVGPNAKRSSMSRRQVIVYGAGALCISVVLLLALGWIG